jgi:rhodanese-related sulfurtransferase
MKPMIQLALGTVLAVGLNFSAMAGGVSPMHIDGATTIDTAKARSLFEEEAAFIDVRKDSDWDAGRIPGAVHLDIKSAFNDANLSRDVQKNDPVVFYCNGESCMRSSDASRMAVGWGYNKVYYYRDGFPSWKSAGNPVE